jgi:hypothetical protein
MLKLIVLGLVVLGAIAVYKLWKAKKTITGASVVAEAEAVAKAAADAVKSSIFKK